MSRKYGHCKYCGNRFLRWMRGRYLSKKICRECSHIKSLELGQRTRERWKKGEITRTAPFDNHTSLGMKGPNHADEALTTQRFIETGIYMSGVLTQMQIKGMFNIGHRTMRNWLNRFYPNRKKWGLGGRFKEREKDIICLKQDMIKDEHIKEFISNYENNTADMDNPIMKAINLWNKKVKLINNESEVDINGKIKICNT